MINVNLNVKRTLSFVVFASLVATKNARVPLLKFSRLQFVPPGATNRTKVPKVHEQSHGRWPEMMALSINHPRLETNLRWWHYSNEELELIIISLMLALYVNVPVNWEESAAEAVSYLDWYCWDWLFRLSKLIDELIWNLDYKVYTITWYACYLVKEPIRKNSDWDKNRWNMRTRHGQTQENQWHFAIGTTHRVRLRSHSTLPLDGSVGSTIPSGVVANVWT